ncbi:MAG: endonuclease III [Chloroflexota bacterium]
MNRETILNKTDNMDARRAKYPEVAKLVEQEYGRRKWRKRGTALDTLIGTILSQNTTDKNSGRAFQNLKDTYPTYMDVLNADVDDLIDVIRVAGLGNQKGPRIQRALQKILDERGELDLEFLGDMDSETARNWLTDIKGIGLKTASIVVSFSFDGYAFPVDTHINRVSQRIGFTPPGTTPEKAHYIMEEIVPPADYFAFHIQLIQHGRALCKARSPKCDACMLRNLCDYYSDLEQSPT